MLSRRNFLGLSLAAAATPALADPLGQRPGIQLYTVRDAMAADAAGTLKQLAAIGYRTVEAFDLGRATPKDFRALLGAHGLTCASCHLGFKDGDNGALFDTAHALGARYVVSAGLFGAVGAFVVAVGFSNVVPLLLGQRPGGPLAGLVGLALVAVIACTWLCNVRALNSRR